MPNSGADEDGRALGGAGLLAALDVAPFRADEIARPGGDGGERDPVLLVRLLDVGGPEVLEDDAREVLRLPVAKPRLRHVVDKLVVFVHAEDAVRRDAPHCEGAGNTGLPPILAGLVVQILEVGSGGDESYQLPTGHSSKSRRSPNVHCAPQTPMHHNLFFQVQLGMSIPKPK